MPSRATAIKNIPLSRALQIAFLVLVILPIILITSVAYVNSRQSLQEEIKLHLQQDAGVLLQSIDAFMFERLENLRGWAQLSVMQDAGVDDVDKRLADFLHQLKTSYGGIYTELMFSELSGNIIASSDPSRIGKQILSHSPAAETILFGNSEIEVFPLRFDARRGTTVLPIRNQVISDFSGTPLGYLYALLNWQEVENILSRVNKPGIDDEWRFSMLVDQQGRLISRSRTHSGNQAEKVSLALKVAKAYIPRESGNTEQGTAGTLEAPSVPAKSVNLLVGYANSKGFQHFEGFGWKVILVESMETAFAPVQSLLWQLMAVLAITTLAVIFFATRLSRWIASPISRLAHYSKYYDDQQSPPPPIVQGVEEVQDLSQAIGEMMERLKKSRQQLVHASKLAAVGELAATLAHEVRTPLGILRSSSQLLQREKQLSPQGKEMVGFILSESERLNRFITLLLESGHPRSPVFQAMDLNRTLEGCVSLLRSKAEQKDITLSCKSVIRSATILGDSAQLEQVFLNLLLNAIQITPEGGTIILTTLAGDNCIEVDVEDSGPGVARADRERIFEPFISRREGGFGLGLTIVQQIVQQHSGTIIVSHSPVLGGACFRVILPLSPPSKG